MEADKTNSHIGILPLIILILLPVAFLLLIEGYNNRDFWSYVLTYVILFPIIGIFTVINAYNTLKGDKIFLNLLCKIGLFISILGVIFVIPWILIIMDIGNIYTTFLLFGLGSLLIFIGLILIIFSKRRVMSADYQ